MNSILFSHSYVVNKAVGLKDANFKPELNYILRFNVIDFKFMAIQKLFSAFLRLLN